MTYKKKISLKLARKASILLLFAVLSNFSYFIAPANAASKDARLITTNTPVFNSTKIIEGERSELVDDLEPIIDEASSTMNDFINNLPDISHKGVYQKLHFDNFTEYKVIDHGYHPISAYNSEVGQTDSDPCTTANGFNVCKHGKEDTIAANFLKFNTRVRIPELFGDRVFVVRDRMNSRYKDTVDVWMLDKQDARKFGRKVTKIEILVEE